MGAILQQYSFRWTERRGAGERRVRDGVSGRALPALRGQLLLDDHKSYKWTQFSY